MKDTVGIYVKNDLDLRDTTWRGRNSVEMEPADAYFELP
jgi:hypothetical protein